MEIVAEDHFIGAPGLVIEILSPGEDNARRDHVTKWQIYGRFGVLEYWIVDPEHHAMEVYQLDQGVLELQATITGSGELISAVLPNFVCRVSDVFNH